MSGSRDAITTLRRHARLRGWLQLPPREGYDAGVKPKAYLPIYEDLLAGLRFRSCTILELGIWRGDSLEMWRDAFPRATIVGLDLNPVAGLELGPRVRIVQGDQTDAELLRRVRAEHAPDGFDLIIDDASHIGITTARSLQALYREHLKPGGTYVIEDWGTGYVKDWFDGGPLAAAVSEATLDASPVVMTEDPKPIPMPSHDTGLVGLVKRLVDHAASTTLRAHQPDRLDGPLPIEWMRVHDGIVALRKPRG